MSGFTQLRSGDSADAQPIQFLDSLSFVHVASEETDGRWSVVEMQLRDGHAPPLHIHEDADEMIHVTSGTVHVHTEDEREELTANDSVVLPRGEPHSLHAVTEATIITGTSPGGFDEFVTAVGEVTDERTVPTEPPSEAAIGRVNELAPEHNYSHRRFPTSWSLNRTRPEWLMSGYVYAVLSRCHRTLSIANRTERSQYDECRVDSVYESLCWSTFRQSRLPTSQTPFSIGYCTDNRT